MPRDERRTLRVDTPARPHATVSCCFGDTAGLCRAVFLPPHSGLAQPDAAASIAGLGVHLFVSRDIIEALAPRLSATPDAADRWAERLLMCAQALIDAEEMRRRRKRP